MKGLPVSDSYSSSDDDTYEVSEHYGKTASDFRSEEMSDSVIEVSAPTERVIEMML